MAERYISIDEIEKQYSEILNEECEIDDDYKAGYQSGICAAMAVPAADVAPVRHGHWIKVSGMNSRCSICDKYFPENEFLKRPFSINYCPNCGAKMDEEEKNG